MDRRTWLRTLVTLAGIVVVTLCAIAVDLSGTGGYTLSLWQPVTLHAGRDLGGGVRVLSRARPAGGHGLDDRALEGARRIIEDRIAHGLDLTEPSVRTYSRGADRYIGVEWAGSEAAAAAVQDLLQSRGQLTIIGIGGLPVAHPLMSKCSQRPHPSTQIRDLTGESARGYPVLAGGNDVVPGSVAVGIDTLKGSPIVDAALTAPAAARVAGAHFPFLGVAIDGKIYDVRLSGHMLPLGAQFQMADTTGSICVMSLTTTTISLVTKLKYGSLPVALQVVDVRTVGPALGLSNAGALAAAALAALLVAAVVLALRRGLPGVLGVLGLAALLVAALVTLAIVKLVALTLTLAGLAGLALAAVLAADAQRTIDHRVREEARSGRPSPEAIESGVARAWPAIRDASAATLIFCAVLWWVGATGAVDTLADVAATLFIGVAVSTAVALVVSPTLLRLAAGRRVAGSHTVAPHGYGHDAASGTTETVV